MTTPKQPKLSSFDKLRIETARKALRPNPPTMFISGRDTGIPVMTVERALEVMKMYGLDRK
jgi:hypothetical protein